jgi:hypothetical protein
LLFLRLSWAMGASEHAPFLRLSRLLGSAAAADQRHPALTPVFGFETHGIGKLLLPLAIVARRQAQSEMPRNMRRLKQRLEGDRVAGPNLGCFQESRLLEHAEPQVRGEFGSYEAGPKGLLDDGRAAHDVNFSRRPRPRLRIADLLVEPETPVSRPQDPEGFQSGVR